MIGMGDEASDKYTVVSAVSNCVAVVRWPWWSREWRFWPKWWPFCEISVHSTVPETQHCWRHVSYLEFELSDMKNVMWLCTPAALLQKRFCIMEGTSWLLNRVVCTKIFYEHIVGVGGLVGWDSWLGDQEFDSGPLHCQVSSLNKCASVDASGLVVEYQTCNFHIMSLNLGHVSCKQPWASC